MNNSSPSFDQSTISSSSKTLSRSSHQNNQVNLLLSNPENAENDIKPLMPALDSSSSILAEKSVIDRSRPDQTLSLEPSISNKPQAPHTTEFKPVIKTKTCSPQPPVGNSIKPLPLPQFEPITNKVPTKLLEYHDSIRQLRRNEVVFSKVSSEGFAALRKVVAENFQNLVERLDHITLQQERLQQNQNYIMSSLTALSGNQSQKPETDRITRLECTLTQISINSSHQDKVITQISESLTTRVEDVEKNLAQTTEMVNLQNKTLATEVSKNIQEINFFVKELEKRIQEDLWVLDDDIVRNQQKLRLLKKKLNLDNNCDYTNSDNDTSSSEYNE